MQVISQDYNLSDEAWFYSNVDLLSHGKAAEKKAGRRPKNGEWMCTGTQYRIENYLQVGWMKIVLKQRQEQKIADAAQAAAQAAASAAAALVAATNFNTDTSKGALTTPSTQ